MTEDHVKHLNLSHQERLEARQLVRATTEQQHRLKGYVGWLLTEPAFIQETAELDASSQAFSAEELPLFPLGRYEMKAEPSPHLAINGKVADFLDRWGLTQLATWDLPEPQGPLLPNPLPPGAPALPKHGIHVVLPLHYPIHGDDDLLRQIAAFQRMGARTLGLDESLAGLPHHEVYATMFDVVHLERSIRARLPDGKVPHGFVLHMTMAMAAEFQLRLDTVQKYRKAISACRSGRRSSVAWLRPRIG
jgi:hypothetical protein